MNRFQFVADHADAFGVKRLCRVLGVARSSFYRWRSAAASRAARARAETELVARIRVIHAEHEGTYGSPRITAELRDLGLRVNHKRIERVMRAHGIAGLRLRRKLRTTVPDPDAAPVPDLLRRDFTADAAGRRYVGDITYLPVADGTFLYLATVLDLGSRRLVGWSIADHMRTELGDRRPASGGPDSGRTPGGGDLPQRQRRPVLQHRFRAGVPAARGDPITGRGRHQRRQRRRRILQRHPQTRNSARRPPLALRPNGPPAGIRLDHPLQHPPQALTPRPHLTDQL